MSHTAHYLKSSVVAAFILLTSGWAIAACSTTPAPTPIPRPTRSEVEVALVPPPTPTTPASPTPSPVILAPDDSCEDCHTDQERLIASADEMKVAEVLSEGEG
jgi:hypothetical protein